MALGEMVDKHPAALEAKLAVVALEDKLLVVHRRDLRHKLRRLAAGLCRTSTTF